MQDTSPEAEKRYFELMRRQTPVARLAVAAKLSSAVRKMAEAGIVAKHPDATPEMVRAHLAARMYGREIAQRLFPTVKLDDARPSRDSGEALVIKSPDTISSQAPLVPGWRRNFGH